jgi:HK97 family phage major capsid protein
MSFESKGLHEERAVLNKQLNDLIERAEGEKRDFNAEESAQYDRMFAESNTLKNRIDRIENYEKTIRPTDGNAKPGNKGYKKTGGLPDDDEMPQARAQLLGFQALYQHSKGRMFSEAQELGLQRSGMRMDGNQLVVSLEEDFHSFRQRWFNSLGTVPGTGAGVTVAPGFISSLEVAQLAFGGMLQVAEVIRTPTGAELPWPTMNDTGNEGRMIGEQRPVDGTGTTTPDPTFGARVLRAFPFTSDEVLCSNAILEDSAIPLANTLGRGLGTRLGRIQNRKLTVGAGGFEPEGIVTAAPIGVNGAKPTAIVPDEVIDLEFSVDPAYRPMGAYMCHSNIMAHLRKQKTGDGQWLWQTAAAPGLPDRLNNYPVFINQHMASTPVALADVLLFGQLDSYKVRQVGETRIYQLKERHLENDQTAFVAFNRLDGKLVDAGTGPVKKLRLHA